MSAYAALFSLKNTIHHIFHSSRLSLVHPSLQIIDLAYGELQLWETILQRLDKSSKSKSRKKVNAVDGRMKETLWNFEDLLESLLSHQIILQSGEVERERGELLFSIDLRSLQDDVDSFIHTLNDMKEEYIYEVDNMPEDEDDPCISSSTTSAGTFVETKSKMIGFSDHFKNFKRYILMSDTNGRKIKGFGFVGMAGVGKTRVAREIYEDPEMIKYFDCRLWITVGRKSSARLINQLEVSRSIVAELMSGEKCLIVLDDVWEQTQELSSLLTSIVKMKNTTIRILLTSRNESVFEFVRQTISYLFHKVESKDLLCHNVFGENTICPPQLHKAATKIAKKCEGLPLTIVTVADLLSKAQNRDPEYWEDVAEERNSVFRDAYTPELRLLTSTFENAFSVFGSFSSRL